MITQITARMFFAIRNWRSRRAAIRQLNALNDHMLLDIGLERGDIPRVVDGLTGTEDRAGARRPAIPRVLTGIESRAPISRVPAGGSGHCDPA